MTLARELADTAGRPQVDKNLLINGGMNIWQRSTSVSGITTSGYRTADRFVTTLTSLGTWTQSRSTDVPSAQGFGYSLKLDCTTANASPGATGALLIQQKLEGQNVQHLLKGTSSAKAVTVSFWVKSSKTGTYILELEDYDNIRHICKAYTIDSANTWEKKELTFDADTTGTLDNDNVASFVVNWWLGAGSNHNSGTLATSWATRVQANVAPGQVNLADSTSNEWYMTGCQLEIGEAATDFQFEPYSTTYNKCIRYFYFITNNVEGAKNWANNYMVEEIQINMRATPTSVSFVNTAGGGSWGVTLSSNTGFRIYSSGLAGKTTQMKIDAEL